MSVDSPSKALESPYWLDLAGHLDVAAYRPELPVHYCTNCWIVVVLNLGIGEPLRQKPCLYQHILNRCVHRHSIFVFIDSYSYFSTHRMKYTIISPKRKKNPPGL